MNVTEQKTSETPLISIGMPVFNGAEYLNQALDGILNQEFQDFELIISDNASTDDSYRICEEYARRDNRIRLIAQSRNIGAFENFQFVFDQSKGVYFTWAAHDDVFYPKHLSSLIQAHQEGNYILVASRPTHVELSSGRFFNFELISSALFSEGPRKAFIGFMKLHHWDYAKACMAYGLFRRNLIPLEPLNVSNKKLQDVGADLLFLYEILATGQVKYIEDVTWQRGERFFFIPPTVHEKLSFSQRLSKKVAYWILKNNKALDKDGWAGVISFYLNQIEGIYRRNFHDVDREFSKALRGNRDLLMSLFMPTINWVETIRLALKFISGKQIGGS